MDLVSNKYVQGLTNILEGVGERIEGNLICDIQPRNWVFKKYMDKINNLQHLCKNKSKIMEIGVNACHSLLLMLLINPDAEYLLFDLNNHKYTEPTIEYIRKEFPNTKINIIYGNSVETIKKYILDNPSQLKSFDLIHLDGGHTYDIFSEDYNNCKKLIIDNGVMIFDDYDMNDIKVFIDTKVREREIVEYTEINILKNNFHFIYMYL